MKFVACGYRVLVKPEEVDDTWDAGSVKLVKPSSTLDREKAGVDRGTVIDIGADAFTRSWSHQEEMKDPWCKIGDKVCWSRYAGLPVEDEELGTLHILQDVDILARWDDE